MSTTGQPSGGIFGRASLYVGDLDGSVTEAQLIDHFSPVAPLHSVRICRDQIKNTSLGYGYVNFYTPEHARCALETLNFTPIHGKPIRIMFSNRDPSSRKSGNANVFIKNLDPNIDNKSLYSIFISFGEVVSCKVVSDRNGHSVGYGYVQFQHEESAKEAISQLNDALINGRKVFVGFFIRRAAREQANGSLKFTNVYIKNLSETIDKDDLIEMFKECGSITSGVVMKDANGNSKGFGFVNFDKHDDAMTAIEKFNGRVHDEKVLYVGRAQKKSEREAEWRKGKLDKLRGPNLYIKNFDAAYSDENLRSLFSKFGTITSCKIMVDSQGQSRGFGFVAFATPEEAKQAVNEMNGKMIGGKPLYVAVAESKEERRAKLQNYFARIRAPTPMSTSSMASMAYHPVAPRFPHQQLYFGQNTLAAIPPQPAGFGFPPQFIPGIRTRVGPNFAMPYYPQRQAQIGQGMGVWRDGPQQVRQLPWIQRDASLMRPRYVPNIRNGVDPSMIPRDSMAPMMPLRRDVSGITIPVDSARPASFPISNLTSDLASATPEKQRVMLGEQLFPLVERVEPESVGKVTGMLLEMDQTEVLHLIESPKALKKKVSEAMDVLREARAPSSNGAYQPDQLTNLE